MKQLLLLLCLVFSLSFTNAQKYSMLHINGITIRYQKAGSGPALVLLHGLAQDSRVWKNQLDSLSKYFTVVAWDAPGAGRSTDPPGTYKIEDWADCLAATMDSAGVKEAHILGLSWGGFLAQKFYQRY